jgi:lysozyme
VLSKDLIGRFEGCHRAALDGKIWPYVCPAGLWTQGWGRLVFKDAPPQDRATVDLWFLEDILKHEDIAVRLSPILRNESERRVAAITSFVYNLGGGAYQGSTLRKRVNNGDWKGAQEQIVLWVNGGGRKLPGLVIRRGAEAALLQ